MNLFNRKKLTIDSIQIPDFGWNLDGSNENIKQWINPDQSMIASINFFALEPDLPTIKDLNALQYFYRYQLASVGGLIQADLVNLKGYDAIKLIIKVPQQPTGMMYISSYTIPFKNYSFVIKIQASEIGVTGMRDSVIVAKLLSENKIKVGDNGPEGLFYDPYDPEYKEGILMSQAEEVQYDIQFPEHPLSKSRKFLDEIASTIEFGKEFKKIEKFEK